MLKLICWGGYTASTHYLDEVCSSPDLLASSLDAIINAIADAAQVSVGAAAAFCVIMRALYLSVYHYRSWDKLHTRMSAWPPVCDKA